MTYNINLGKMLARCARIYPERLAIIDENRRVTYRELNEEANRLAHNYMRLGLSKGDKIGFLLGNCAELVGAVFGALKMGGVVVILNWRWAPEELWRLVDHTEISFLVYGKEFSEKIDKIRPRVRNVKHYVICHGTGRDSISYESLLDGGSVEEPDVEVGADDVASITHTSGTTGFPKGAVWTHSSHLWGASLISAGADRRAEDTEIVGYSLNGTPFFRAYLVNVLVGSTAVFPVSFDILSLLRTVEKERAVFAWFAVPTWIRILEHPDLRSYNLECFRKAQIGGQIIPIELKRRIKKSFPELALFDMYGATEAGPISCLYPNEAFRGQGCVGIPCQIVEVRIVDEEGQDVPKNDIGEIVIAGPNMMRGYYKNEESTQKVLGTGWLHTGDLGKMDEDGYLYIVDRKVETIISGGFNVYPAEVEGALLEYEKIKDVAVIGIPDPLWGESVKAIIVPKPGEVLTSQEAIDFCRERLASYKKPRSVEILEELPRDASGKVLKRELRKKYAK